MRSVVRHMIHDRNRCFGQFFSLNFVMRRSICQLHSSYSEWGLGEPGIYFPHWRDRTFAWMPTLTIDRRDSVVLGVSR